MFFLFVCLFVLFCFDLFFCHKSTFTIICKLPGVNAWGKVRGRRLKNRARELYQARGTRVRERARNSRVSSRITDIACPYQAPVVQRVDSVIRWISCYPVDEICRANSISPNINLT